LNNFTGLIPLPTEKRYEEQGPVRQKMGRILSYIIRLDDDSEFCEQIGGMLKI